jgi:hypothetical protein
LAGGQNSTFERSLATVYLFKILINRCVFQPLIWARGIVPDPTRGYDLNIPKGRRK